MTEKRFTFGGTDEEPLVKDNITGKEYPTEENSLMELLNELHEKNHFLKEKEKDMLDYLKKEYDYVYNQKRKHFDDAILVRCYELIEYHIKSMIEHLEGL